MKGPPSRRFNWQKLLLHLSVLGLVLWGVWGTIARALHELGEFPWQIKPGWLVLSAALYALGMLPMGLFWFHGLRALGQHPQLGETLRAYYIGHLGKYVPGKAMVVVIRAGLLRSERVNLGVAAASVFLETLTMMAVGAMMAAGILIFWTRQYFSEHTYLVPLAVGLMLLAGLPTLPPVFRRLALRLGVARKDPDIEKKLQGLTYGVMATGWALVSCGWVLLALSLWAVVRGMGINEAQPIGHLHFFMAAAALAVVAGFLSLLPGGAGVRELILTAVLGEVYFSTVLQLPLASAAALASAIVLRLVWLAVELLIAAVLYFFGGSAPPAGSSLPDDATKSTSSGGSVGSSTKAFVMLLSLLFLSVNVPGDVKLAMSSGQQGDFRFAEYCEHGWPLDYLRRERIVLDNGPPYSRLSLWNLTEGVNRFRLAALVVNAAIGCALIGAAGFLFEWRRRRRALLRFSIGDLLVLTAAVAGLAAWYVSHRSRHDDELSILRDIVATEARAIPFPDTVEERVEWQRAGPTWLRRLVGERPFTIFDRVFVVFAAAEELPHVVRLPELRAVVLTGSVTDRQLRVLEQAPQLEALNLQYSRFDDDGREIVNANGVVIQQHFTLPKLPNLRALNLSNSTFAGDGLENVPVVEALDLAATGVDDSHAPALAKLSQLKQLRLTETRVSAVG